MSDKEETLDEYIAGLRDHIAELELENKERWSLVETVNEQNKIIESQSATIKEMREALREIAYDDVGFDSMIIASAVLAKYPEEK